MQFFDNIAVDYDRKKFYKIGSWLRILSSCTFFKFQDNKPICVAAVPIPNSNRSKSYKSFKSNFANFRLNLSQFLKINPINFCGVIYAKILT